MNYEDRIKVEIQEWIFQLQKNPGILERSSRGLSKKINEKIPKKVHDTITASIKGMTQSIIFGVDITPKGKVQVSEVPLLIKDQKAKEWIEKYKKIGAVEGAGTGAGGILLGLVDFPALLSIKMKLLFELAHIYGYNTKYFHERLYILNIFQLAFSGYNHRLKILNNLRNWESTAKTLNDPNNIDWEKFQQEYRDSLDFRKMLQMLPGIGAVVGAWANFKLIQELGDTAMNSYRMRILNGG
ncbi:EcsC family protein [Chengkuizengella axinellae]|uniref:EcsC family protein n=1 Tax=Chengkuizengella axinellae TaxID=3064388 RepID=A0ABT9IYA0_9BACL|nr:EcsC family protein [Chengkuizengella sp. 2205SS18-9]MDP5274324.1 EcsC family protein [Chengkuizengella sp. 2205SS18-9]